MLHYLRRWFQSLPFPDAIEHILAQRVQALLLVLLGAAVLDSISSLLNFTSSPSQITIVITGGIFSLGMLLALLILRRGRLAIAVALAVATLLLGITLSLFTAGLQEQPALLFAFVLPLLLAGLVLERRGLLLTAGTSAILATVLTILEQQKPAPSDPTPQAADPLGTLTLFLIVLVLLIISLNWLGTGLRTALRQSRAREKEIAALRDSLEVIVAERTTALQAALAEVQTRAQEQAQLLAEQARLLVENEQHRGTIRELSIPVIPVSATTLVMPLIGALDTGRLQQVQSHALQALERTTARYLILDVTGVPVVDSQVAQGLLQAVQAVQLLGGEAILVGIRPEVAQAIVQLGLELPGLHTYRDLESALGRTGYHRRMG